MQRYCGWVRDRDLRSLTFAMSVAGSDVFEDIVGRVHAALGSDSVGTVIDRVEQKAWGVRLGSDGLPVVVER